MKRLMTILATLFLLNNAYSQDYTGVDDAFFSSIQPILNKAKGQKISSDEILNEQVFTSATISATCKNIGLGISIRKYVGMVWSDLSATNEQTYITNVNVNPKLYKLRLTFGMYPPIKRYYFFKGDSEGDFTESSNIDVYFLEKDQDKLVEILNRYKIYPRSY
jgi:hypothetical protein